MTSLNLNSLTQLMQPFNIKSDQFEEDINFELQKFNPLKFFLSLVYWHCVMFIGPLV